MGLSFRIRGTASSMALSAALIAAGWAGRSDAQTPPPASREPAPATAPAAAADDTLPLVLDLITVEGTAPPNTLQEDIALDRLPGTVQDTPQAIQVIPQEILEQQRVTTLEEALRNVPGVTVTIGEGNGGMNGDQFRIRGLDAKGDIYQDGLRDFGVYTRDSFNIESIQVLKGPSGESYGSGTTGGAINTASKLPRLDPFQSFEVTGGTGLYARAAADINQPLGEAAALRLNVMAADIDVVGRDGPESQRWGFAPSIGFGLGTDLSFTLGYFHQHDDRVPDYGVPVVTPPGGGPGQPVTEFGVDRANWYGNDTDTDESDVDVLTGRLTWHAAPWLTVHNDTRFGYYERYFTPTPASCGGPPAAPAPDTSCVTYLFDGDPSTVPMVSRGGPGPFDQESWGWQNVTTAVAAFDTGPLRHELVAGFDIYGQHDERNAYSYSPSRPQTPLEDPDPSSPYAIIPSASATAVKETDAINYAVFASDRVWLTDAISVVGGLRVDWYHAEYDTSAVDGSGAAHFETDSTQFNPKASLVWEPTEDQTYYLSYARSSAPQGAFVANAPNPISGSTDELDPEVHESFEAGAKLSLFDGRLGLTGAAFQINKDNASETDPITGDTILSGDAQRIRGLEFGVTGRVTEAWTLNATYTYLDAETVDSSNAANEGKQVQYVPRNAFSVWTSYDLSHDFDTGPGQLLVGGGVTYRDRVYLNAANTSEVPENLSFDAFVSYEWENWRVALNGINLTDRLNYDQVFGNRARPAPGRTVLLTVAATF